MKQKEIKILTDDELKDKLDSLTSSLYETKVTHAVTPIENPMRIKVARRFVARIKTEINSKANKAD